MKKATLFLLTIAAILLSISFTSTTTTERTITLSAEQPLEFDMVQNGIITNGLKTPYKFKFNEDQGKFIFRSKKDEKKLKLNVEKDGGGVSAEYEIIVLIIDNDKQSTFGMD